MLSASTTPAFWRFLPFLFVVLAVDFGLHLYLYRRLVKAITTRRSARIAGACAIGLMALLMGAGPAAQRALHGPAATTIVRGGYLWMALGFYLFLALLAGDLLLLAFTLYRRLAPTKPQVPSAPDPDLASPSRRDFLRRGTSLGAAALAAPAVVNGIWTAFEPARVSTVEVRLPNLPRALSGMSLVQLSDIHVGAWVDQRFLGDLVQRAQALKPDLFTITGDLVDGPVARLGPTVSLLGGLRSRYGTYFCTGNHDYYSGADEWCAALRQMGISVLRNQRVTLGDAGASFELVGVDDWGARRQGYGKGYDLEEALAGADPDKARILLAHQPLGFDDAVKRGVGLQLSGHTHGGQLWPWMYMVHLVYPYVSGRYQLGDSTIYVNRGCGFWGPPVRLGVPPEIVRVVLT